MEERDIHERKRKREEVDEIKEKAKKDKEWKEQWEVCKPIIIAIYEVMGSEIVCRRLEQSEWTAGDHFKTVKLRRRKRAKVSLQDSSHQN